MLCYSCLATSECPGIGENISCLVQSAEKAVCSQQKGLEMTPHHPCFIHLLQSSQRLNLLELALSLYLKSQGIHPSYQPGFLKACSAGSSSSEQLVPGSAGPHMRCPPLVPPASSHHGVQVLCSPGILSSACQTYSLLGSITGCLLGQGRASERVSIL